MNRKRLLSVFTGLRVFLVLGATVMVFAQDRIFDPEDFAATLGSTMRDPAVNEYLAERVSQELIAQVPNLAISGPLLVDVTGSVLESDTAVGIVEFSAREAHRVAFEGGGESLVLELSDLVASVQQALKAISPELAESIPQEVESLTVALSAGELTADTVRFAEQMRLLTSMLVALAGARLMALVVLEESLFRGGAHRAGRHRTRGHGAGLHRGRFDELVYTHDLGDPLPPLGDMIDSGRRVFIMVEENGEGVDWLHPAFSLTQETPFSFASVEEFSCAANRGEPDSPLFVVNHFITLAVPSNQSINDFDPLSARAEQCQTERGMRVNLLALDFIGQGDVMAVVDQLNEVGG